MNKIMAVVLFGFSLQSFGQISDDFSDGDFTNNPTWSGSVSNFIVNASYQLQLNQTVAGTSFLSTSFVTSTLDNFEWQFRIRQSFAPSANNYGRVYLTSNQSNLTSSLTGYYLQFGETGSLDAIELFRQSTGGSTSICRATSAGIANAFDVWVKVQRDASGLWKLFVDYAAGTNFTLEATGTDATYNASQFLGVVCTYTASNANRFYFDDFSAGPIPVPVDNTPPTLQTLEATSANEILLTFSEPIESTSAENVSHYLVNQNIGTPSSATLQSDQKTIKLNFSSAFTNGVENELTLFGIKDLAGNTMQNTTKNFRFFIPQPASALDLVLNEIFPDPSPQIGLPAFEFVEIYNRSNKAFDLANWKLSDPTTTATLPSFFLLPNEYVIVTTASGATEFASFGKVIALNNFPTLNNSGDALKLSDNTGLRIDSVNYALSWYQDADKEQGGWTLERLNPQVASNDNTNWQASIDVSGGTPGRQNSVLGKNPDSKAPVLNSLQVISQNQLLLEFNEVLGNASIQISNFMVNNNIGLPANVTLSSDQKIITLEFLKNFQNGLEHVLTISGVMDLAGNVFTTTEKTFRFLLVKPVQTKDVILTEIMADPTPVVQLPEAEFIEIYNRTDGPFDVGGWKLADATSVTALGSFILLPGEYLILTSNANVSRLTNFGKVLGVASFPSLNNAGEALVLKTADGSVIDSVNYEDSWYRDLEKKDGGWSMELIDLQNTCAEENNWTASEGELGGTPGKTNSVNANKPDVTPPKVLSVITEGSGKIHLTFNEKLTASLEGISINLSPTVEVQRIEFTNRSLREVAVYLKASLQTRLLYTLTLSDVRDCAGNRMPETSVTFALPENAESKDIVINELLFNPRSGGVDFIELYNRSEKFLNLKNWKTGNFENEQLSNDDLITSENLILSPGDYLVLTSDPEILTAQYPQGDKTKFFKTSLPSLPDDEGSIALVSDTDLIIDAFHYSDDFHFALLKDEEGVSLERISASDPTQDVSNWRSASAQAGFATPGYVNSNSRTESAVVDLAIYVEPEIFSRQTDFARIHYKLDQPDYVASIKILDAHGRLIKEIANNQTIGYEGFFRWDGDQEDGSKARFGHYTVWVELFNLDGVVKRYRKRVVVSGN